MRTLGFPKNMFIPVSDQITPESYFSQEIPSFSLEKPIYENEEEFLTGITKAWKACYTASKGVYLPNTLWLPQDIYAWANTACLRSALIPCSVSDYLIRIHRSIARVIAHPRLTRVCVLIDERSLPVVAQTCSTKWMIEKGDRLIHPGAAIIIKPF